MSETWPTLERVVMPLPRYGTWHGRMRKHPTACRQTCRFVRGRYMMNAERLWLIQEDGKTYATTGEHRCLSPLGGPGDIFWVREPFQPVRVDYVTRIPTAIRFSGGRLMKITDRPERLAIARRSIRREWCEARTMAIFIARTVFRISSLEVRRLHSLSDDEIRLEGFGHVRSVNGHLRVVDGSIPDRVERPLREGDCVFGTVGGSPRYIMELYWRSFYGPTRKALGRLYEDNPWIWRYGLEPAFETHDFCGVYDWLYDRWRKGCP